VTAPDQPIEAILERITAESAATRAAEEADQAAWRARQVACDHRFTYLRERREGDAVVVVFYCNRCLVLRSVGSPS
jgi:uncharacterized UBP type Zn finger protein